MDIELSPRSSPRRALISAFILFTATSVGVSCIRPVLDRNPVGDVFLVYAYVLRIFQRWELFIPEPRREANYYRVDITFKKGTGVWRRTAAPNWSFFERQEAYNFQKWDLAGNDLDTQSQLWYDLSGYIVRKYDHDPANPMVSFKFIKALATWPAPKESGWVGGEDKDLKWEDKVLFTYYVKEGKLFE